jgi:hypothetical protein
MKTRRSWVTWIARYPHRARGCFDLALSAVVALAGCSDGANDGGSTANTGGAANTGSATGVTTTAPGSTGADATGGGAGAGGGAGTGGGVGGASACVACSAPAKGAAVAVAAITEASGLAASALHPGVAYAHNDSGDSARFFAFDLATGEGRGEYVATGAPAVDWEDMARGPCADPAKSCLYFADIGDNAKARSDLAIVRVEEPATLATGTVDVPVEVLSIAYPDGPHDAEALLVDPTTGDLTIVTKAGDGSFAYELAAPLQPNGTTVATLVGPVALSSFVPLVTGGDVHPGRAGVVLRTYTAVNYYPLAPGQRIGEALAAAPCVLEAPVEMQGEAIAWTRAGDGWFTLSEGAAQATWSASCP